MFFFGFISGIIIIIAISFGSFIFIIFSKTLFQSLFSKYYLKYSDRITSYINNSSYEYLILLRLLIGPPLIFQNICISLLNLSNKKILISTIVGFTPLMLIFSYVGSYASNVIEIQEITLSKIISPEILFILLILILFILVKIFVKK